VSSANVQELGRGDGAAMASAGVLDVGNVALDLVGVLFAQRQPPELLAGGGQRRVELGIGLVVVRERARIHDAQRHHAGAGQRSRVDQVRRAQLLRVGEPIGQHQAAFGIGVDHVDGLAGHGGHHVAGLVGFAVGHVLRRADNADHAHLGLEQGNGAHGAQHGRAARHVVLHQLHLFRRLDGDAAGVERNSLAHQAEHRAVFTPSGS
jgi:hypothetical protein